MFKKTIALLLVLLMLVPFVVSCKKDEIDEGGSDGGDVSESQSESEKEDDDDKYDIIDGVGTRDYSGRSITIAHVGNADFKDEISPDRLSGDVISDAIYKRDRSVEERLNVELHTHIGGGSSVYSLTKEISDNLSAGLHTFDIMLNPIYTACGSVTEGYFYDLNQLEDINFDQPYWGEYANEAMEVGGVQYVATGAIALNYYRFVFATVVNDRILSQTTGEVPDLIEVVENKDWTLEYQTQLANKYYSNQGAPGKDEEDLLGFYATVLGSVSITCDPYLSSCGITIINKNSEGYLEVDFDLSRASDAMQDITDLMTAQGSYCSTTESKNEAALFGGGNVLMTTLRFYEIGTADIRNMEDTYTILPIPLLDKDQDDYYSALHDSATGVAVPITLKETDIQTIGAVIEVMASESYRTVTPAYYENVLRTRYVNNPDNWEIVDKIFTNAKMDPITPFTNILTVDGVTPIKHWRRSASNAVSSGTSTLSSRFSAEYLEQLKLLLDGPNGLNTYYKSINSN